MERKIFFLIQNFSGKFFLFFIILINKKNLLESRKFNFFLFKNFWSIRGILNFFLNTLYHTDEEKIFETKKFNFFEKFFSDQKIYWLSVVIKHQHQQHQKLFSFINSNETDRKFFFLIRKLKKNFFFKNCKYLQLENYQLSFLITSSTLKNW